jgi:hypothetical protein
MRVIVVVLCLFAVSNGKKENKRQKKILSSLQGIFVPFLGAHQGVLAAARRAAETARKAAHPLNAAVRGHEVVRRAVESAKRLSNPVVAGATGGLHESVRRALDIAKRGPVVAGGIRGLHDSVRRAVESAKRLSNPVVAGATGGLHESVRRALDIARRAKSFDPARLARESLGRLPSVGVSERLRNALKVVKGGFGKVSALGSLGQQREARLAAQVRELQGMVLKQASKIGPSRASQLQALMHARVVPPPPPFRPVIEIPPSLLGIKKRVPMREIQKFKTLSERSIQSIIARRERTHEKKDGLSSLSTSLLRRMLEKRLLKENGGLVQSGYRRDSSRSRKGELSRREKIKLVERAVSGLEVTARKPRGLLLAPTRNENLKRFPSLSPPGERREKHIRRYRKNGESRINREERKEEERQRKKEARVEGLEKRHRYKKDRGSKERKNKRRRKAEKRGEVHSRREEYRKDRKSRRSREKRERGNKKEGKDNDEKKSNSIDVASSEEDKSEHQKSSEEALEQPA